MSLKWQFLEKLVLDGLLEEDIVHDVLFFFLFFWHPLAERFHYLSCIIFFYQRILGYISCVRQSFDYLRSIWLISWSTYNVHLYSRLLMTSKRDAIDQIAHGLRMQGMRWYRSLANRKMLWEIREFCIASYLQIVDDPAVFNSCRELKNRKQKGGNPESKGSVKVRWNTIEKRQLRTWDIRYHVWEGRLRDCGLGSVSRG